MGKRKRGRRVGMEKGNKKQLRLIGYVELTKIYNSESKKVHTKNLLDF